MTICSDAVMMCLLAGTEVTHTIFAEDRSQDTIDNRYDASVGRVDALILDGLNVDDIRVLKYEATAISFL